MYRMLWYCMIWYDRVMSYMIRYCKICTLYDMYHTIILVYQRYDIVSWFDILLCQMLQYGISSYDTTLYCVCYDKIMYRSNTILYYAITIANSIKSVKKIYTESFEITKLLKYPYYKCLPVYLSFHPSFLSFYPTLFQNKMARVLHFDM